MDQMSPKDRELWGKAAEKGWAGYVDNSAVEIGPAQASSTRSWFRGLF